MRRYKNVLSSTSDRDGRRGCPLGLGDRGGHGPSQFCVGSPHAAWNPLVMLRNDAAGRPQTEGSHAKAREFRPGAFPESTTPMDLPRAIGWTLSGVGWKCGPRVFEVLHFSKTALYTTSSHGDVTQY